MQRLEKVEQSNNHDDDPDFFQTKEMSPLIKNSPNGDANDANFSRGVMARIGVLEDRIRNLEGNKSRSGRTSPMK